MDVQNPLDDNQYICKTDVKSFYESIDQYILMEQVNDAVCDRDCRHYLYQVIHRSVKMGDLFKDIDKGISRGCPLSPIFGALYLKALDDHFSNNNLY
ncbi:MAG: retron-type reverse transcriptase [Gammaproteobacteria bacterium]